MGVGLSVPVVGVDPHFYAHRTNRGICLLFFTRMLALSSRPHRTDNIAEVKGTPLRSPLFTSWFIFIFLVGVVCDSDSVTRSNDCCLFFMTAIVELKAEMEKGEILFEM